MQGIHEFQWATAQREREGQTWPDRTGGDMGQAVMAGREEDSELADLSF